MGIRRDVVKVSGLKELKDGLEALRQRVQNKVVRQALTAAAVPINAMATTNARRHRAMAEARGYKDKDAYKLHETIGQRVKTYRRGATVFLAAGPMYRMGGYHGHLVEFGHRVVKGGSLPGKRGSLAGLTAAGKRYLRSLGLSETTIQTPSLRRGGRKGRIVEKKVWRMSGFLDPYAAQRGNRAKVSQLKPGSVYKIGDSFLGTRVRGGGRIMRTTFGFAKRTKAYPYLAPAFEQTKRTAFRIFMDECRSGIASATKLAKNLKPVK